VRPRLLTLCAIVLLAPLAAWGVLTLTDPPGPGLDPDAMAYLGTAQSIAAGRGVRVPSASWAAADSTAPLAHFPPGYPTAIAIGVRSGLTPVNAARAVMATAAAATVAGALLALTAGGSLYAGLLAVLLLAVTPTLTIVHGSVLSEPLYLALTTLIIALLSQRSTSAARTITLAGLATIAMLTRYAGASLVAAVVLDTFSGDAPLWRALRTDLAARIKRAVFAGAIPALSLAAWTLSRPKNEGKSIRQFGLYTARLGDTLAEGLDTTMHWLAPGIDARIPFLLAAALVGAGVITLAWFAFRTAPDAPAHERAFGRALARVAGCYVALIAVSRLVADGDIPLDDRILAPLIVIATLGIAHTIVRFWRVAGTGQRLVTLALTIGWLVGARTLTMVWVNDFATDGGDLAGRTWALSPLVEYARSEGRTAPLISNWPSAIWFHTGRPVAELPKTFDAKTAAAFRAAMERKHAALLVFSWPSPDAASPDTLARMAGLVPVHRYADGVVWRAPSDTATIRP
jgi:hypothetical protein